MEPLNPVEVRVLGALIEKAVTTPDYYPLSLNALASATNQTTNRDPVVRYDEATLSAALESLRTRKLVNVVHRGESRVERYRHVANETWGLEAPEMAVIAVLLLRGPQTVGEIRGRTARLHEFTDIGAVQESLDRLARREPEPFVRRLPRRPGQKDARYCHRLAGEPSDTEPPDADGEPAAEDDRMTRLEEAVDRLRDELDQLRERFDEFRLEFR